MSQPTLYLVDGSSYLHRAYHALPSLSAADGQPTGAIYGVANMLRRLLHEYQPTHAAVVFDAKGKTFRHEIYPEYKATRPPIPEALAAQISLTHELTRAMGFPLLMEAGVEADDVLATLARRAEARGWEVLILSGDKDLAQLVNERITMLDTMKDLRLDVEGVKQKFGVWPGQIVDYLALIGDSVDNVPGVAKVGPKTAVKWLETHGSLDALLVSAEEIKGKVGDNLRAAREQSLPLSRRLVSLRDDLELDYTPEDLRRDEADWQRLRELYQRLDFRAWLSELQDGPRTAEAQTPTPDRHYQTLLTWEAFAPWLEKLKNAELFAFDTETTSLEYMNAELVGLSFAVRPGEAAYLPLGHDYLGAPRQLERDRVLAALKPLLEDPARPKLGQHIKYDMHVMRACGIVMRGVAYDTMLESYIWDAARRHDMDSLARHYLGLETTHYQDIAGKGAKQIRFNQIELERAAPYAAEDADITLRLHGHLWPKLRAEKKLREVLEQVEMPLVPVLFEMEHHGVKLDAERLHQQSRELDQRMKELVELAHQSAGESFNLGSTQQLQRILYQKQGLPIKAKTPKGQPSTAEEVLQELALDHELPRLILEYRGLGKLKSTYTDKLPRQIHPRSGRVHTSYHQAVAQTGRLSSSDPNLQNIPARTEEGRRIRQAFVAEAGCKILSADYSQIELRIMAHLSRDPGLLQAFAAGEDIHRATAAEVFDQPLEQVTREQRRAAKAINFGLIYGMSAFGLGRQLGIPRGEAQKYVDQYFARYPGVRQYMEDTRRLAAERGYVETVFGRRLYLPEINSRNGQRRNQAERAAINAPMQGTAADIIKYAMIRAHHRLQRDFPRTLMIMQVHDELIFEVPADQVDAVREAVLAEMRGAADLSVELVVEAGVGNNWDEAH